MSILDHLAPELRRGLSVTAIRLLTGEPEPPAPPIAAEKVVVPPEHYQLAARHQLEARLRKERRKRQPKRRN